MNNKFLKITIAIFIVLAVIASLPWLDKLRTSRKENNRKDLSVNLSKFTRESVEKISIKKGNDERILSYADGQWRIGEDEADEEKINQLFQDFSEVQVKETASENESNHARFEVTKDTGIQLTITQSGKSNIFFAGKAGTAAGDFYLRKDGVANVYLMNGNLRDKLIWEAAKWKKEEENEKAT